MTLADLGKRIRFFRILRHLTLAALGRLLNITRQAVARYEKGEAAVPVLRIPDLCAALHITPDTLFRSRLPSARRKRNSRARRVRSTYRDHLHRLMRCPQSSSLT